MTQGDLFAGQKTTARRPWKRTTGTSKAALKAAEDSGRIGGRTLLVSVALRAWWNRMQVSPTSDELAMELWETDALREGDTPRDASKRDWYVLETRRRLAALHAKGAVEHAPNGVRPSAITGRPCETWRAIERGTSQSTARNEVTP